MIDGVKFECNYLQPVTWLHNDLLDFPLSVSEKTGEIIQDTRIAKHQGLKFKITPSSANPKISYCNIEGSLHRYHNGGGNNSGDFTGADLTKVINELRDTFGVISENSIIHNIEFGVNISLPIKADQFLKFIISTPDKRFSDLSIDKIKIGKVCSRSEYDVKVYDKGKQCNILPDNLIRIELKIKKMRWLQSKVDIKTIADLRHPGKLERLGQLLLDAFDNLIIYDYSIKHEQLTARERLLIKDFQNPMFWERLNFRKRYKSLKSFRAILQKYNSSAIHKEVTDLIRAKWIQLNNELAAENRGAFHRHFEPLAAVKVGSISPLEYRVKSSPVGGEILKNVDIIHILPKNRICQTCGRDISNQRTGSIFCSERVHGKTAKRCRNTASGQARTERNRAKRQNEAIQLNDFLKLDRNTFKAVTFTTSDRKRHRRQIGKNPLSKQELKKVILVRINGFEFTTLRAKKVLTYLLT